ncbi:hypothetical protein KCH_12560 [Kitasatospora cheerisanensis KCTC 2395]|uniref:Uncharacterized protein n=1 Tax=Kitasatospora cheerisanensis KCTC 2395 TaxID=1348663 RepID=A0A066ZA67_9ACTN|nr:hypothetical protein KCH_12560 [Kitasatospora cheerisanensis KCTC 2395]
MHDSSDGSSASFLTSEVALVKGGVEHPAGRSDPPAPDS